jgi:predicted Zn-dependent protease with MMP-like domain
MVEKMANVLKEIFVENWDEFVALFGDRIRKVVVEEVEKMMGCGDIENGYLEYSCQKCGEIKKIGFRCRSRFCTSCGKGYVDQRSESMTSKLIKTKHRHMVFTIAEELREYFQRDRKMLEILPRCAADVLKAVFKERNKMEEFVPGIVTVIHTFGRDLKWNPHVHVLVSEGGSGKNTPWKKMPYIHYERLRKSWQKLLLDAMSKRVKSMKFKNLKNKLYSRYNNGFYVYGKGEVKNERAATQYVGRYTGRPAIANSRIVKYDGKKVTIYYEKHEDGQRVEEEMDVMEFIKKVIIHIADKQFKMVRYYGIYASHAKKRPYLLKMVDEKIQEIKRKYKTWRYRIMKSFGYDPLKCEKCGNTMELTDIYYPKYGSMMEIIERIELAKIKKEIEEVEKIFNAVKNLSNGRIEPLFV